ncbi:MAG TPA: hypothetical protein VF401_03325 [Candidatus Saccharimonadales bacterium]
MDKDFEHLHQLIRQLEQQADANSLSEEDLKAYQQHLDTLAHTYQTDETAGSQRFMLYELQALIWQARGDNDKAVEFLQEASALMAPNDTFVSKGAQQWYEQQAAQEPASVPYRNPVAVGVLGLVTFNLYTIYWLIVTKNKLNEHNKSVYIPSAWRLAAPIFPYLLLLLFGMIQSSGTTSETWSPADTVLVIVFFLAFVMTFVICMQWYIQYCKAVSEYTQGKISTVLCFVLLWLTGIIGAAIIQDSFNKQLPETA